MKFIHFCHDARRKRECADKVHIGSMQNRWSVAHASNPFLPSRKWFSMCAYLLQFRHRILQERFLYHPPPPQFLLEKCLVEDPFLLTTSKNHTHFASLQVLISTPPSYSLVRWNILLTAFDLGPALTCAAYLELI